MGRYYCSVCKKPITKGVLQYSYAKFGVPLCREHQANREKVSIPQTPRKGFTRAEWNAKFRNVKDFYKSKEWARCRIKILKRDKYTCHTCKQSPARVVHHINDPQYHPEMCLDPANLMTLCDRCHDKWHQRG